MKITNQTLALIRARFRDANKPKINQSQLADHVGLGKAWASKLMNKKIQNITEEIAEKMEQFLGIKFQEFADDRNKVSPLAMELTQRIGENQSMAKVVEALLEMDVGNCAGTRWIATQDMNKVGQQIIDIAITNQNKPGKVASLVLQILG